MNSQKHNLAEKYKKMFLKDYTKTATILKNDPDFVYDDTADKQIKELALKRTENSFAMTCEFEYLCDEWYKKYNKIEKKIGMPKGWFFITIRPNKDVKFHEFHRFINDLFRRKCWTDGYYVWEQKGDTKETIGNGFHIHAIVRGSVLREGKVYYLNRILTVIKNNGLDDKIADNCVDIKPISDEGHLQILENYTNTKEFNKDDPKKEASWNFDREFRQSKELPDVIHIKPAACPSPFFKSVMERET